MKKVITNTLKILLLIVSINVLLYLIDIFFLDHKVVIDKVDIVVMGDSNARNAINDSKLTNSINLSQGGESYLFAYIKLKKILEDGNKIDTLLLTFAPHNIINNKTVKEEGGLKYRIPVLYRNISFQEHTQLFEMAPDNYIKSWMPIGRNILNTLLSLNLSSKSQGADPHHIYGGYSPLLKKNLGFHIDTTKPPILTSIEIDYLDKIIDISERNNIHLILICTPKNYSKLEYEKYRKVFYDYYDKNLNTLDFLDFSDLYNNEEYFSDVLHLMSVGADTFSIYLKEEGFKKLLNSSYNLKKK